MKTKDMNLITWILVSIIILGIILLLNSKAFGQEWTAEQKEVWEVVEADYELFKQGDLEGILESRHDDVAILYGNKPIPYGKEMLSSNYKAWFDYDKPVSFELEPLAIKIIGNVVSVFYTYKFSGKILSGSGRAMKTWIKQDNRWILINSHSSSCDKLPPCN
jgi:ketosteroid isomerase-like protein